MDFLFAVLVGFIMEAFASGAEFGEDEDRQTDEVEQEHRGEQTVGAFGRAFEFPPDEDAPAGANHGRPLAQSVGESSASLGAGDDAKGHADIPDHPTEDSNQVKPGIAFGKIVAQGHWSAGNGLDHHDRVPKEIGEEQPGAEQHDGSIRAEFTGFQYFGGGIDSFVVVLA